ncbi:MAG: hypothetical protein NVS2B3_13650 [Vulcanimicrobiaceae bacterium]
MLAVDCYYHQAVPSVAVCHDCTQTICATCRDGAGICPGCRLERKIRAAGAARPELAGERGRRDPSPGARGPRVTTVPGPEAASLATVSGETRGLLALGYPVWPLAALALLDPKRSPAVRRQAMQALGLNFGLFGLSIVLQAVGQIPLLGWSAWPLLAIVFPVWLVATVVYAVKVWNGDDVRVPLVSDWLDEREARRAERATA